MSLFGADGANQALGMIGSSALSWAAQSHGAYKQYKYQKKLQEQSYRISRRYRQTAYQDTRKDLEKANFNPILAVGQGATSSGMMSSGSAQSEDYSSAINSALDYARYHQDKKLNEATVKKTEADTELANTQTYRNQIDNYFAPSIAEANISQINSATELNKMKSLGQMLENDWYPQKAKAEIYALYNNAQANLVSSSAQQTQANVMRSSALGNQFDAKEYQEFFSKHPHLYKLDKTLTRYLAPASSAVGAGLMYDAIKNKRPGR